MESMPSDLSGAVIDPSAGEGALLHAVERRYSESVRIAALDIDRSSIDHLRIRNPNWAVSKSNIFDKRSRQRSPVWRRFSNLGVSAAVLNPPFSYRGGAGFEIAFGEYRGILSPAAAFLAIVLEELRPSVGVWAVLPKGILGGRRCEEFWREVEKYFVVSCLKDLNSSTFPGVRANAVLVSVVRRKSDSAGIERPGDDCAELVVPVDRCTCIEIIRGRIPRHSRWDEEGKFVDFLHTTDIGGAVRFSGRTAPRRLATVGKCLVIPRVGNPNPLKVSVIGGRPIVLSDCLYALRPVDTAHFSSLKQSILERSEIFADAYIGTGARHVTIGRLEAVLKVLGYSTFHVQASSLPGGCRCGTGSSMAA